MFSLNTATTGILYGLGSFALWGMFPIYFKALGHVPALEVLAHRIVWSVLLLGLLLLMQGRHRSLITELRHRRTLGFLLVTTVLISINWLVFIWAIQNDRILEASLGYYINPLVSVVLGVIFLSERLSRRQVLAVLLAAVGVLVMVIGHGTVPWASLALALSFGGYGLLRKQAKADAVMGLFIETSLMAPFALIFLGVLAFQGGGAFGNVSFEMDGLLAFAGVATVAPLLLFLEATQRLRLSTVGLMQYLAPTLHFLLAVAIYHEPFTRVHLITFACIWIALAIYSLDALSMHRAAR
jgi:chloramphenicol-sensitive protein RarD